MATLRWVKSICAHSVLLKSIRFQDRLAWTRSPPSNKRHVCSFVNLAGYYRCFMDGYATMTRPITLLLKDNTEFYWNEECDCGFTQVKDALALEPILCNLD